MDEGYEHVENRGGHDEYLDSLERERRSDSVLYVEEWGDTAPPRSRAHDEAAGL